MGQRLGICARSRILGFWGMGSGHNRAKESKLRQKGYKLDHKQVKSWWTRFKGLHKIVDFLLHECSGFGWDDTTKCVTAMESVWHNLLYNEDGNKWKYHND
ncbi:hypothetical protein BT96DRAFT_945471 [Gymnopus androsaceus JB14]|uniref:Myb/SANT-like domain-containing protein n=1 Tax=Gymnopus androsaceus JB14 TaxID=1447944 RepID=A0A6A4H0Q9_9AGAR|nr:hypothetical protein BT96DRAFT_945471 [Gymnopus androsaceus JB14]